MNIPFLLDTTVVNQKISIWEMIMEGKWYIMGPLGILSLIAIYIFIERFLAIQKADKEEKDFMHRIRDYIHGGKLDAAKDLCANSSNPIARMIEKGISRIGKPTKDIAASIENVGKIEIFRLEKGLSMLATIAGVAPMIGFLGTVLGMINTFHALKVAKAVHIDQLSGGMMMAMVTTVAGLIIGIIAYMAYNVLVAKVDKVVHKMEGTSIEFIDLLEEPGN
jgi:biopolymer transport protein ExbB